MKNKVVLTLLCPLLFTTACERDPLYVDVSDVDREVELRRFDRDLFNTSSDLSEEELRELKTGYPWFFEGTTHPFWRKQRNDTLMKQLSRRVEEEFPDLERHEKDLRLAFKHYFHYYPEAPDVEINTYISGLDFDYPVIFADTLLFIALDMYLGGDEKLYSGQPAYISELRDKDYMLSEAMLAVAESKIPPAGDKAEENTLLASMIRAGQKLYFTRAMTPWQDERNIIRYTKDEMSFCRGNEVAIWTYFVDEGYLFSTQEDLKRRFIHLAPFSKFYMKFDNKTPGRIGQWVGWQIVKKYAENNPSLTLEEIVGNTDYRQILKESKYKPR